MKIFSSKNSSPSFWRFILDNTKTTRHNKPLIVWTHKYTIHCYYHWSFYYDAAKLLQEDNCIIIISNCVAWWSLNDLLLCLVGALGLKDYIMAEYIIIPRHIWFFQVVQLRQEVVGVMSSPLIMSVRPKNDIELYKFISNASKRAFFKQNFTIFSRF